MTIPILSLIDKILAGLPDNARYRTELAELRAQFVVLADENEQLKAQIAKLKPKSGLPVETGKVLQLFFKEARELHSDEAARLVGMEKPMVEYHMGVLRREKFILPSRHRVSGQIQVNYYKITQAGMDFVVENGLN